MDDSNGMIEGSAGTLEEMLLPRVEINSIANEKNPEKVNAIAFELYKETLSIVSLAAHLFDSLAAENGGWSRNQAICAGLLVRIAKFMLVVTQLGATKNRADVVMALNRSIMESAINLEFLVGKTDDRFYEQFIASSLGPEGELYDLIQANVAARGGEVLPIERRMLASIDDLCKISGVKIEDVNRRHGDWGGGVRERLKCLDKEQLYSTTMRVPSHAVHGTWVDLYKHHLKYDRQNKVFKPDPKFSWVDTRSLAPMAVHVLEAVEP
jgi:hypothetical protein